jgi:hypothetical protein
MEKSLLISKLESAIQKLQKKDAIILDPKNDLNERTVTFRLAMYPCSEFKDYDVDCEYNRMVDHSGNVTEGDYWVKKVYLTRSVVSGEDDEARTVFPDIIIHRRKQLKNLAVIEVKMAWKNSERDFDLKKLTAYKNDLGYQYAIYIEIAATATQISFIP